MGDGLDDQHHELWLEDWEFSAGVVDGKYSAAFTTGAKVYRYNHSKLTIVHDGVSYDLTSLVIEVVLMIGADLSNPGTEDQMMFFPPRKGRHGEPDEVAFCTIYLRTDRHLNLDTVRVLNTLYLSVDGITITKNLIEGSEGTTDQRRWKVGFYSLKHEDHGEVETETDKVQLAFGGLKSSVTYLTYTVLALGAVILFKLFH